MSKKSERIDAHCHVFNNDVLKIRLVAALLTILEELEDTSGPASKVIHHKKRKVNIRSIIEKIQVFSRVLFSSSEAVFRLLNRKYKNASHDSKFSFIPLMFDSEFCITIDPEAKTDPFNEMLTGLDNKLEKLQGKSPDICSIGFFSRFNTGLSFSNSTLIPLLKQLHERQPKGFVEQLESMEKIKGDYPDSVFPFLAVDPRRKNIADLVKKYFDADVKIFSGIKLYAPNGFSPMDPRLFDVYSYCSNNKIPITAHCSYGGFATLDNETEVHGFYFDKAPVEIDGVIKYSIPVFKKDWIQDRARYLNHPELWKMVLSKYKELRLNLAHFGIRSGAKNLNDRFEWTKQIVELMKIHPNLYTDLSCYTKPSELKDIKKQFLNIQLSTAEKVIDRVMYGSDFFLNLMDIDSFESYYDNFFNSGIFTPEELDKLTISNPAKFLSKI